MAIDGICNDHLQIGSIGGQAWTIHGHGWNAMESQYGRDTAKLKTEIIADSSLHFLFQLVYTIIDLSKVESSQSYHKLTHFDCFSP